MANAAPDSMCPGCNVTAGGKEKVVRNPPCQGCATEMLMEMWEWYSKRHRLAVKCDSCKMRLTDGEYRQNQFGYLICSWCGGLVCE